MLLSSLLSNMSIPPSTTCVTDCSILNLTTCQLVSKRRMVVDQDIIYSKIWSQDGCYNSTLFQATEGYKVYEKVTKLTVFTLTPIRPAKS